MDWSGVDYLWIIGMFLSAVWTLILTAPIHCRASIGEQVMQCYISPNLMTKQTNLHLGWPENILHLCENVLCSRTMLIGRVYLEIWRSRAKCLYLSSCHFPLRWCKAHLPKNGLPPPSKASLSARCIHSHYAADAQESQDAQTSQRTLLFNYRPFYWNAGWVPSTWRLTVLERQDFMKEKHSSEGSWSWCSFSFFYKQNLFLDFQQEDSNMSCTIGSLGWELFYFYIIINNREMRVQIYHLAIDAQLYLWEKPNSLTVSFWCIYTFINTLQVSEMLYITQ